MKRYLTGIFACLIAFNAIQAAIPSGYYSTAEGKYGQTLLTALYNKINSHTNIGYDGLWDAYQTTDVENGYLIDMYSTTPWKASSFKKCGSYSNVGDCVNREHSFPKSWWGGNKNDCYSDIFHLYPTDGFVNNQRSNFPFGVCADGVRLVNKSNGYKGRGRLGTSTYSGYSGKVWEPDDEFKGDFARTYFYMATCYNNLISSWNSEMLAGNKYPVFSNWALNMLLEWHRNDPVSEKETKRNDAAYAKQKNRNPFIDYPELAEHIWGNQKTVGWVPGGVSTEPVLTSPSATSAINFGVISINTEVSSTITVKGANLTKNLTVSLSGSNHFSTSGVTTITAANANAGTTLTVKYITTVAGTNTATLTISSSEVSAVVNLSAQAVDGIPANAASNVTETSFVANWTNVSGAGATYKLYVYDNAEELLSGYPKNVTASTGKYTVTGLEPNTTYRYKLTYSTIESNVITVTTLAPTPIIGITIPTGGMIISCAPGEASPILESSVYTEYITEDVDVDVTGNFELSLDKANWSNSITMAADGETFYIRLKNTATAGTFSGTITASTYTLDGTNASITGIVAEPQTFLEEWEDLTSGGYWTKEVEGNMCNWSFNNTGIWADSHKNGGLSCRLGKNADSSIEMLADKPNGAGTISFYAAKWSASEATPKFNVLISNDGGTTWQIVAQDLEIDENWEKLSFSGVNIQGAVRLKIQKTAGGRFNVDDISITDYKVSTVIDNVIDGQTWDAYVSGHNLIFEAGKTTKFEVYDMEARLVYKCTVSGRDNISLPAGIYVVCADDNSKKVIIK